MISEEELLAAKTWLSHYSEPWTKVLNLWTQTAPNRLKQLDITTDIEITDILKDWPAMKHPVGWTQVTTMFISTGLPS